MSKKPKDRHLDVPAEANRDKHVNFVADERSEIDPSNDSSVGRLEQYKESKSLARKRNRSGRKDSNSEQ